MTSCEATVGASAAGFQRARRAARDKRLQGLENAARHGKAEPGEDPQSDIEIAEGEEETGSGVSHKMLGTPWQKRVRPHHACDNTMIAATRLWRGRWSAGTG
jgi:hypothetical protein